MALYVPRSEGFASSLSIGGGSLAFAPQVKGLELPLWQALRLDVVRVPAEQSLADYLNSGWMEGVDKGIAVLGKLREQLKQLEAKFTQQGEASRRQAEALQQLAHAVRRVQKKRESVD